MKRVMSSAVILVFALLFMPAVVQAQNAANATPNVGYDGGFFVKNDDDTFKLTLGGRLQPKVFFQYQAGQPQQISFQMRRAQLDVMAKIHEAASVGFTLKHATVSGANTTFQTVQVASAVVSVEVVPEFTIAAGMVGLPLDMITETSSAWFLLMEAPATNTEDDVGYNLTPLRPSFGAPDGLGLNFSGGYSKWFYSLSVVNGTENNYAVNPDRKVSVGFRTGVNVLDPVPGKQTDFECSDTPKLTVSAGTMYQGKRTDPTGAVVKYLWTSSLGVGFRLGGFALTTEGYYRKMHLSTIGNAAWARPNLTDIGYYAAIGYYFIPKKFEIAGQVAQTIRQGPSNDMWQFGGGLNYYIFGNNLKLQLAYTLQKDYNDQEGTIGRKINNVALMATAKF